MSVNKTPYIPKGIYGRKAPDKKTPPQKRLNFDIVIEVETERIQKMSMGELTSRREGLKRQLENIHDLMREPGIEEGRRKYLKGQRMVITILLGKIKTRHKAFNKFVNNRTPKDLATRFVQQAAEVLPLKLFQKIYGLAMSDIDSEQESIDSVEKLMQKDD